METILMPCRVPWAVSRSTSGVTLIHSESDVDPACTVVFGGGRMNTNGLVDSRRIEIQFVQCYYARSCPHDDSEGIEAIGYRIEHKYNGGMNEYLNWRTQTWQRTGFCPDSGFYVAKTSEWLSGLPDLFQTDFHHYIVDGRNGYAELVARRFRWREWLWIDSHREDAISRGPVVGSGKGIAE